MDRIPVVRAPASPESWRWVAVSAGKGIDVMCIYFTLRILYEFSFFLNMVYEKKRKWDDIFFQVALA